MWKTEATGYKDALIFESDIVWEFKSSTNGKFSAISFVSCESLCCAGGSDTRNLYIEKATLTTKLSANSEKVSFRKENFRHVDKSWFR